MALDNNTYSLCEAVADITSLIDILIDKGTHKIEDSREKVRLAIEWAEEFEKLHEGRLWGETMPDGSCLDYSETVEAYTSGKMADYAEPTPDKPSKDDRVHLTPYQLAGAVIQIANGFGAVDQVYNDSFDPKQGRHLLSKRGACAKVLNLPLDHVLVDFYWAMHEHRLGQVDAIQYRIGNAQ